MSKRKKKTQNTKTKIDTDYAHNPRYCMIMPDAEKRDDEDISSTGQS